MILTFNDIPTNFVSYLPFYMDPARCIFGWNSTTSKWEFNHTGTRKILSGVHNLLHGTIVTFGETSGVPFDKQFVINEGTTIHYGQLPIKDNLQKYELGWKYYTCKTEKCSANNLVPVNLASCYGKLTLPEVSDSGIRDFDSDSEASRLGIGFKLRNTTDGVNLTFKTNTSQLISTNFEWNVAQTQNIGVGKDIATGSMIIFNNNWFYGGANGETSYYVKNINPGTIYYAIRISATVIKLALTPEDAVAGINIVLGSPTNNNDQMFMNMTMIEIPENCYFANKNGTIMLHKGQIGKTISAEYIVAYY